LIEDNDVDTQDEKIPGSSFNCIHSFSFFLSLLFRRSHKRFDDYVIYSPRIDLSEGEGDPHTPSLSPSPSIQKRINVLNERYNNKEINAEDLMNGLSLLVANKK
jgi:hypothetical protein